MPIEVKRILYKEKTIQRGGLMEDLPSVSFFYESIRNRGKYLGSKSNSKFGKCLNGSDSNWMHSHSRRKGDNFGHYFGLRIPTF